MPVIKQPFAYPLVKVIVLPALVQGENASRSIVKRIEEANAATKSLIVKSVSCPTADIIGMAEAKIARATISSLNAHNSNADRSGRNRRPPHDGLNGTDKNGGSPPDKSDAAAYQQEKRTGSIAPVILRVPFSETIVYPKRTA
jgi:hypothetical protein